jgi:predicted ATPase
MLEHLLLKHLGPAPELDFEFGNRLNIVTGDNGVGKSFLLDVAWWALTRTWADGRVIHPAAGASDAAIHYHVHGKGGPNSEVICTYRRSELDWGGIPVRRPPSPGLVLYARIDGGFSLWDPERNGGQELNPETQTRQERPVAYQFSKHDLWDGLKDEAGKLVCRGLLEDWETWSLKANGAFEMLKSVLAEISPGDALLAPGKSVRVPDREAQDTPTLLMPYGQVPLHHTSAGIRRILSLAYMIVWAWTEHSAAAALRNHISTKRIVLLWDEVEAHLHPQWQRTILPAIVKVLNKMLNSPDGTQVQIIATTHAPFTLASLETIFDEDSDRLFNLELNSKGKVVLEPIDWAKRGDVVQWLRSPAFDMKSGYSREAELALVAAVKWIGGKHSELPEDLNSAEKIENELKRTLAGDNPFWPRWLVHTGNLP